MYRMILFIGVVLVVLVTSIGATTIHVPAEYLTIQEGINASSNGDTVRVASGTYLENIDFSGKNIVVGSWFLDDSDTSYISLTIIDGGASGSVVTFENGEDNSAVITGFTIQNGHASNGGGIYCVDSNPTISNNTISENSTGNYGGGIQCSNSSPTISNNTISGNSAGGGGGIGCNNSSPTINYNTISGNSALNGGGIAYLYSSPTTSNNIISGNSGYYYGGGIYCGYSNPTINYNTISGNTSDNYGGGIYCWDSNPVITNTIFWADSAPTGPEIHLAGTSTPVITYCDVQGGWAGETNIDCDPMFCDPENGNFYLDAASCCVGAGEGGVDIGAFGVGCYGPPDPVLSLSSHPFFADTSAFYPSSGDENTLFEFRINYLDSASSPPQSGYPKLLFDWDGNGIIDHANDDSISMSPSEADTIFSDGVDYSVFFTIPSGGNPKIKFEAYNSYGGYAAYPSSGWLDGPEIFDENSTDLFIYADDITFSTDPGMPETGEDIIISARVHNSSPDSSYDVKIDLLIDDMIIESFYLDIPPTDINEIPGHADLSYNTIFTEDAYLEIKFEVDPDDSVNEISETNNSALRGLIVGDYDLLANIHINAFQLTSYYPSTRIYSGGTAWYEENAESLTVVTGAPVYLKLLEGDVELGTSHVNDYGYFSYSFIAPANPGFYTLQIAVTDFTLSDTALVSFEIVSSSGPNLVIDFDLVGLPINECDDNILYIDNPRVINVGQQPAGASKAMIITGTNTLLYDVPGLEPDESYILSSTQIPVSHTEAGDYFIKGIADYDNEVMEDPEGNNEIIKYYKVHCCPLDLSPVDIRLNRIPYINTPVGISAKVYNLGGVDANNFSLKLIANHEESPFIIGILDGLSISAYEDFGWFTFEDFVFSELGYYQLTVIADPELLLDECDETNNMYSEGISVGILTLRPDITVQSGWINLSSLNPDLGDTVFIENVDIYNVGDSTAYDVEVLFTLTSVLGSDTLGSIVTIPSIPPSGYESVAPTESTIVEYCIPNLHIFKVETDPYNTIAERNESNNTATKSVIYCEAPDLYVKEIYFEPECGGIGDMVNIIAVVADSGGVLSSALIDFYYLDDPDADWADTIFIATIGLDIIHAGTDTTKAILPWEVALDSTYIYVDISYVYPNDYNPENNDASALFFCLGEEIPTLSEWGMIILALLVLAIGTVAVIRRRRVVAIEGRQ